MDIERTTFDYKRIAEGYAKDRPFLHGQVIDMLKEKLSLTANFEKGLDVGCGAGLSTKALRRVCNDVTGTDIAEEMIKAAAALHKDSGCHFVQAAAEEIQAKPDTFSIVTAAGVINWVDETKFLPLLGRIMKEKGILLVYDFWITDRMEQEPAYTDWYREQYLKAFPKPPRKENVWTKEQIAPYHFQMLDRVSYEMRFQMNEEAFIRFMLLQSNVIAQVEEKGKSLAEVRQWFEKTLAPCFADGKKKNLVFEGYSWYMQLDS